MTTNIPITLGASAVYSPIPDGYAHPVGSTVGKNLKALRQAARLRQVDVAVAADLEQGTISKYERDEQTPSIDVLLRLAVALNQPIDRVLAGQNDDYDALFGERAERRPATDLVPIKDETLRSELRSATGVDQMVRFAHLAAELREWFLEWFRKHPFPMASDGPGHEPTLERHPKTNTSEGRARRRSGGA